MIQYTWFQIMSEDEEYTTLECQHCGETFTVNTLQCDNMCWSETYLDYVPICPRCGTQGE